MPIEDEKPVETTETEVREEQTNLSDSMEDSTQEENSDTPVADLSEAMSEVDDSSESDEDDIDETEIEKQRKREAYEKRKKSQEASELKKIKAELEELKKSIPEKSNNDVTSVVKAELQKREEAIALQQKRVEADNYLNAQDYARNPQIKKEFVEIMKSDTFLMEMYRKDPVRATMYADDMFRKSKGLSASQVAKANSNAGRSSLISTNYTPSEAPSIAEKVASFKKQISEGTIDKAKAYEEISKLYNEI